MPPSATRPWTWAVGEPWIRPLAAGVKPRKIGMDMDGLGHNGNKMKYENDMNEESWWYNPTSLLADCIMIQWCINYVELDAVLRLVDPNTLFRKMVMFIYLRWLPALVAPMTTIIVLGCFGQLKQPISFVVDFLCKRDGYEVDIWYKHVDHVFFGIIQLFMGGRGDDEARKRIFLLSCV